MDEGFMAAWAFFRAVEHVPMDDDHNDLAQALVDEFGEDDILRGLALVAAVLRDGLITHARRLGCSCGSDAWLERMQFENASKDHGE
jgi:hypothetical protein